MHSGATLQETLDSSQYSSASIRQYELVYGDDFVSPGGHDMTIELIAKMHLQPGARVLDVGCGLGGSAFVMARRFGLLVDGIDLSKNMLVIANAKLDAYGLAELINLKHGDCLTLNRPQYYDAVYSRDVFLHIHDKTRLFAVLRQSLRPGGKLLFTDYCCGEKPWGEDFSAYVSDRGYRLHTLSEYAELITAAGFEQVQSQDLTAGFITILQSDLKKINNLSIAAPERSKLQQSWQGKLARARSGDHRWGLFSAVKD